MKRRILGLLLILSMAFTLMPLPALAVEGAGVAYLDENGSQQAAEMVTAVTESDTSWGSEGATSWYVATAEVSISGSVKVNGDVRLILEDGCSLTVNASASEYAAGINVTGTDSLTIYAQSTSSEMGSLSAGRLQAVAPSTMKAAPQLPLLCLRVIPPSPQTGT